MLDIPNTIQNPGVSNGKLIFFPNGYGASIIDMSLIDDPLACLIDSFRSISHSGYEIAVLIGTESDWTITYNTAITDDTIKNLSDEGVISVLKQIEMLPSIV